MATMEALLLAMVHGGFGGNGVAASGVSILDLRQVKIVDIDGNLRRVFPAKGDLVFNDEELVAVEMQQ